MKLRFTSAWLLGLAMLAWGNGPALAQHEQGGQKALPQATAAAMAAPASAAKPARKPKPQLGIGTAFAPDGSLWWVGLSADNQLVIQSASVAPSKPDEGSAKPLGLQWSAPRVIDIGGDPISADGENHPKLLFGSNNTVLIAYTQPLPKPNTGFVRMLRSTDGGKTFSKPYTVHADRQEITHRFESIAFDAKGVLHAIWIDKRDLEAAPKVGNKSSYRGAAIYRASSVDGGATFGPDTKVADHSCECCRIALAQGNDGVLNAMWRHVYEPDVRDHAFAALDSAAAPVTTVRATFDEWHVNGCPHHGPGLAAAADGGFHTVWFGIRQQDGGAASGVRYARLNANGSPDAQTVRRLPDDRAEHASVMAHGQRVAVVWRSSDGMVSTLKAWLSTDGGQTFTERKLAQVHGDNDFARPVQLGARMAVMWRNPKEVQVYELVF
jgi:hypothetical protein